MRMLFIDDEERRMMPVVEELKFAGHDVIFKAQVDSAVELINNQNEEFDLVVIDVSMPPGQKFQAEDTYGGARTGIHLYNLLRIARPKVKIIVLTNVADRGVEEHFRRENPALCRFIRKPSILPFQFVEEIENFVSQSFKNYP